MWVSRLLKASEDAGQPLGEGDYLFAPLTSNKRAFKAAPYNSRNLISMVVGHFCAAGVYRGQTPHGIRRGAIQHALGYTRVDKVVMKKSGIESGKNLDRYADRKAHADR